MELHLQWSMQNSTNQMEMNFYTSWWKQNQNLFDQLSKQLGFTILKVMIGTWCGSILLQNRMFMKVWMSFRRSTISQIRLKSQGRTNLRRTFSECRKFTAKDRLTSFLTPMSCLKNIQIFTTILCNSRLNHPTKTFGFLNHPKDDKAKAYLSLIT